MILLLGKLYCYRTMPGKSLILKNSYRKNNGDGT